MYKMIISGANNLENDRAMVDKLNVFPVPDGDTGTNMSLTMNSAITELKKIEEIEMSAIGKAVSKGSLMGARGNSGVILSQLMRGFAQSLSGNGKVSVSDFADALAKASEVAYDAVIKPVEGTILTVSRETAEFAVEHKNETNDFSVFFDMILDAAKKSLNNTPELLKALKEANVVDSGGRGYLSIIEGWAAACKGNAIDKVDSSLSTPVSMNNFNDEDIHIFEGELEFGYCTEFMVLSDTLNPDAFRREIESLGDSMVVVGADGIVKIHIHTNEPGIVLSKASAYGMLDRIKIENMRIEYEERLKANKEAKASKKAKKYGIISVSMGEGLADIMRDFSVDEIIEGGQTMNPSTNDFIECINKINAETIFVLPNNSNIIMAANQAAELSDKNIVVIPSKNIPQALMALMTLDFEAEPNDNKEAMMEAIGMVKSGQVTFSVRNTVSNGLEIKEGQIIGIGQGEILANGEDLSKVTQELIDKMYDEDVTMITLFYGADVSADQAEELRKALQVRYQDIDIELYNGGQPLYYYLVSIE
ncbi:MAG: DAK2 domain-containing protein [Filifactoraceae bacterium]